MTTVIVMAYRSDPEREVQFRWVVSRWRDLILPEAQLLVATSDPFTRARALNAGIRSLRDDAIVVQVDPDSFVERGQVVRAIQFAGESHGVVVAFDEYRYLSADATDSLINHDEDLDDYDERGPGGVGNVVVFSRSTWNWAGGYDERFPLWGGDDGAFSYAASTLVRPLRRIPGPMYHLWHPRLPESVPGHPGYGAQMEILGPYRDANGDREAMTALIESR